jgi:hypothetical protein
MGGFLSRLIKMSMGGKDERDDAAGSGIAGIAQATEERFTSGNRQGYRI